MGAVRILAFSAFLVLVSGVQASAARPYCLRCHEAHRVAEGGCVSCHRGNPASDRKNVAHAGLVTAAFAHSAIPGSPVTARGVALLSRSACRRCHRTGGEGNRLAADLDDVSRTAVPAALLDSIRKPALHMPDFRFPEESLRALVNAVLANGRRVPPPEGEAPLTVHFEDAGREAEHAFVRICGRCHKALSRRLGGVGRGDPGPNLSGLFTAFYPRTFPVGREWTQDRLKAWVRNPRSVKLNALMPPVPLSMDECAAVVEALR